MSGASRSGRVKVRRLLRIACALLLLGQMGVGVLPNTGRAQTSACVADAEPNDAPETAMAIAGTLCIEGTLTATSETGNGDQDVFAWTISETDAAGRWTFTLTGLPAQQTRVDVYQATPAGTGVTLGTKLLSFTTEPTATGPTVIPDLLFVPGLYALGVSKSGGEGPYRLDIASGAPLPVAGDAEPNDAKEAATPLSGEVSLSGDLAASSDWYAWTLSEAEAARLWRVAIQGAAGLGVTLGLYSPDSRLLVYRSSSPEGRLSLDDLRLTAGTYFLELRTSATSFSPYVLETVAGDVPGAGQEAEPNDDPTGASSIGPDQPATGRISANDPIDYFRFTIDDALAGMQIDIKAFWRGGPARKICLVDAAALEIKCASGERAAGLIDLVLAAGDYGLTIQGDPAPDFPYVVRFDVSVAPSPEFETEPNDRQALSSVMGTAKTIRGRLVGQEIDYFRFTTEGQPQLWTIEAIGPGVTQVSSINAANSVELVGGPDPADQTARIWDLYLVAGEHWLTVEGTDGEYEVRLIPLGPPPPGYEREPNNMPDRAPRLLVGESAGGQLVDINDRDVYRFFLAAEDRVSLQVEPPADGAITLRLEQDGVQVAKRSGEVGVPLTYDALLPPGEYALSLVAGQPSKERYRISLTRGDPFARPADLEPNDSFDEARYVPPDLTLSGAVSGEDTDWYLLPEVSQASNMTIFTGGGEPANIRLVARDGGVEMELPLSADGSGQMFQGEIPVGLAVGLEITGYPSATYLVTLAFAPGPAARAVPQVPVSLALTAGQETVAAYSTERQRIDATLSLTNNGAAPLDLTLDAVASHYAWQPLPGQPVVTIAAGETVTVPVTVSVAPDAWADEPVQVSVRARTGDGAQQTVAAMFTAEQDASPVNPEPGWALPVELLGGLDVAWTALGAQVMPQAQAFEQQQAFLHDGITLSGARQSLFVATATVLPFELTVDLAGDEAIPVAGFVLNPVGAQPNEMPRGINLLLSVDGVTFDEVYSGELSTLPGEQAIVLPEPVPARYARLRIRSNHGPDGNQGEVVLAEWKVIAQPGAMPDTGPINLADPAVDGHIVWAAPQFPDPVTAEFPLTEGKERLTVDLGKGELTDWALDGVPLATVRLPEGQVADERFEWVIGFRNGRAARIAEVQWIDPNGTVPEEQLTSVDVEVSRESPVGPWESLGTWDLTRNGGDPAPFDLDEPVWARYVRFVASGPDGEGAIREFPATIQILEQSADDTYRSILSEWGQDSRTAIYEALVPPVGAGQLDPDAGNSAEDARALALGEVARDQAQAAQDEDWYTVEVPEGQNTLRVTLTGLPTVGVEVSLFDETGAEIDVAPASISEEAVYLAAVEPGRYALRVVQPRHSVVISFDTSLSLSGYATPIYQSLGRFTEDVTAGQEAVNYLPFGEDFLLEEWSDDALTLQTAMNDYPRTTSTSNSEEALLKATDEMATRPGSRAVLIITDADSASYQESQQLWAALALAKPRVFAVHISAGTTYPRHERQVMQDWAAVNAGYYGFARTQGEFDVAFDRAATWLRRPATYTLTAEATFQEEATPEPEPTATPEPTSVPEATSTPEPEPTQAAEVEPGLLRVVVPRQEEGESAVPPVAAEVAIELILDTSGSMLEEIEPGVTRMDVAKDVVRDLVTDQLPAGVPVALRVFGSEPDSCDTELRVPLQPLDPEAMAAEVEGIELVNLVNTPLGAALDQVANDLQSVDGPKIVVLVTDGEETCGGDPRGAIERLAAQGVDVHVNIVGFALDDEGLKEEFQRWARLGNGQYIDAGNAEELDEAMQKAVAPPYRVLDAAGNVVATGVVGGSSIRVPPGTYTVEVLTEPVQRIEGVVIEAGERHSVRMDED